MLSKSRLLPRARLKEAMRLLGSETSSGGWGTLNPWRTCPLSSLSCSPRPSLLTPPPPSLFRRPESSLVPPSSLALQDQLPALPVPSLKDTLPKLLRTVRPLVTDAEYEETFRCVRELAKEGGEGHRLQALLEERAGLRENWMSDWWLEMAYLAYRDPVVVWSSPGIVWPSQHFEDDQQMLRFAARAVAGALDYKIAIDQETVPVDMQGGRPLDMQQYFKIFGTCRQPSSPSDAQSFNPDSRHIVVIHRDQFYRVDVYGDSGEQLSAQQIEEQLGQVFSLKPPACPGVGVLTSLPRDLWAQHYPVLARAAPGNASSLRDLETCLFTLSLDPSVSSLPAHSAASRAALVSLHGGGSPHAGANRWHDKCVQLFVTESGECGMTYEHSPAEGPPLMLLTDHILAYAEGKARQGSNLPALKFAPPRHLPFVLTPPLADALTEASVLLDALVADVDVALLHFTHWGTGEIKSLGFSPDSFIQTALQLAFYREQGEVGAHYESGGTRQFLHGRTEVIRSCSIESRQFCRAMEEGAGGQDTLMLMKTAIQAHNSYAKLAVSGLGVDRHLQGLKLVAQEAGLDLPNIYSDPGFLKSGRMRISSSQVAGSSASFLCFGPLVSDGYGVCYNPRAADMLFPCSALRSCPTTSAPAFRDSLERSLLDMRALALQHSNNPKL